jgi:hypothetical protein
VTDAVVRAEARVILTARRLVHGQRDENNVRVTLESLVFHVTKLECALAAEARDGQKES